LSFIWRIPRLTFADVQDSDVPEDALPQVCPVPSIPVVTVPFWLAMALAPALVLWFMERLPLVNSAPTCVVFTPFFDPTDALPLVPDMLRF
jgi:hypothetical protein